jgi:O-antigen/teichoic acid export membrane protein
MNSKKLRVSDNKIGSNIIANYLARIWTTLIGIFFLPLYVQILGLESYGLIGAFTVIQSAILILDFGITPTLNREMARLKSKEHTPETMRDILRSFEILCLFVSIMMTLIVILSSSFLAVHWLQVENLSLSDVVFTIKIMGVALALRWLEQVYKSALLGMQDQVWLSAMLTTTETIRWGGAYIFIACVNPSIEYFFYWQVISSILSITLLYSRVYHNMPFSSRAARFDFAALKKLKKFIFGMTLSSILVFFITQADKIVIGGLVPLSVFSIYILSWTVAAGLLQIISPLSVAVFPRFAEYVAAGDDKQLKSLFQRSCELMSFVLVGPALVLSFFSYDLMLLWTGNFETSASAAPVLSIMALAILFNGLMNLPYMLQLAFGWVSLSNWINGLALLAIIPSLFFLVPRFGLLGGASAFLVVNLVYVFVGARIMFRRLIPECEKHWYSRSIFLPLICGSVVAILLKFILPIPSTRLQAAATLAVSSAFVGIAVLLILPTVRQDIVKILNVILAWKPL